MTWPPAPAVAVVVLVVVAAACDLRTRRVPNVLTFGAAAGAVALHGAFGGWSGVFTAAAGWTVGLLLFLPLFALGGMGAGDVKLLAAIGACLGPIGAVWTALYGAIAGGVMALVVSIARGYTPTALGNIGTILRAWVRFGVRPVEGQTLDSSPGPRLPYALALATGTLVTLWIQ